MKLNRALLIVCVGGGSGGHLFPALAAINWLDNHLPDIERPRFVWIASLFGIERSLIRRRGIACYGIPCGKLRRYFSLRNFADLFLIAAGLVYSLLLLLRLRPDLLFSKGGYVSVPVAVAARLLGIPVITHESDLVPGLATRINSRFARLILVSYEDSARHFASTIRRRVVVTGNPVREELFRGDAETGRLLLGFDGIRPIVLFLGGSLGAAQINELVDSLRDRLCRRFDVVHQCGRYAGATPSEPQRHGGRHYICQPFFDDRFAHIVAASHLVICRAGAGTLWELSAQRKPAILIPLRGAGTRGDQVSNAAHYRGLGAAIVIDPGSPEELLSAIGELMSAPERLRSMGEAAGALPSREAAQRVAERLWQQATRSRAPTGAPSRAPSRAPR